MADQLARRESNPLDLILVEKGENGEQVVKLVDPDTGEMILLPDASTQLIAAVLGRLELRLQEVKDSVQEAKRWLGRTMVERMNAEHEWTQRARGVKVTAPSPAAARYSWNGNDLRIILDELVAEGLVTREAALRACESRVENVPVVRGLNQLLKDDKISARILTARSENPPPPQTIRVEIDHGEL